MNRREALKKLGVGGAVVVGATAVKSLPAFAFANPVVGGILDVTVTGRAAPSASISIGDASCTGSALAPCVTCLNTVAEVVAIQMTAYVISLADNTTSYAWGIAPPLSNVFTSLSGAGATVSVSIPSPYTDPTLNGWGTSSFQFRHLNASGGSVIDAAGGDSIQITGYVEYNCTYGDSTVGSAADTQDFQFTKAAGANSTWSKTHL